MTALPPGYVKYDEFVAVHLSVIRRFSDDHARFLRILPDINSDPNKHDRQELIDTLKDSAMIDLALATWAESGEGLNGLPEPLFFREAS